jgi:glucarate dehydratase
MAMVRKALKTPLATNMCTTSFEDIPRSIQLGSEDIILSDHHFWGGLQASMTLAGLCQTYRPGAYQCHSNSHLELSWQQWYIWGSAIPNLKYALDTSLSLAIR